MQSIEERMNQAIDVSICTLDNRSMLCIVFIPTNPVHTGKEKNTELIAWNSRCKFFLSDHVSSITKSNCSRHTSSLDQSSNWPHAIAERWDQTRLSIYSRHGLLFIGVGLDTTKHVRSSVLDDEIEKDRMTSRNLTSNFLEFRDRAARDRNFHSDDRVSVILRRRSMDCIMTWCFSQMMIVQHWFKMTTKRSFNSKRIFHHPGTIVLGAVALADQVDCRMDAQRRIQMQFDQVRSRSEKTKRSSCFEFRVHRILLVKKLQQLHDKHLTRPDFDENSSEEKEIESITKDMTTVRSLFHFEINPVSVFRRCWMDVMHLFNN